MLFGICYFMENMKMRDKDKTNHAPRLQETTVLPAEAEDSYQVLTSN